MTKTGHIRQKSRKGLSSHEHPSVRDDEELARAHSRRARPDGKRRLTFLTPYGVYIRAFTVAP